MPPGLEEIVRLLKSTRDIRSWLAGKHVDVVVEILVDMGCHAVFPYLVRNCFDVAAEMLVDMDILP